jgi:hypothetical protein
MSDFNILLVAFYWCFFYWIKEITKSSKLIFFYWF